MPIKLSFKIFAKLSLVLNRENEKLVFFIIVCVHGPAVVIQYVYKREKGSE